MSIAASIAQMEHYLNLAKAEDAKLQKGTRSSAAKVRSALLEIGKECSGARKAALEAGKAIPVKKRVPKAAEAKESKESKESKSDDELLPEVSPVLERQDAEVPKAERGRKPKASVSA